MLQTRKANDRGHLNHGWLDTYHMFSFADYYDAAHMGIPALRVINEDRVLPGQGFGTHGHRDMEIITYVLAAPSSTRTAWATARSFVLANSSTCRPVTGIRHSESNRLASEPVHLYQIWIQPNSRPVSSRATNRRPSPSPNVQRMDRTVA